MFLAESLNQKLKSTLEKYELNRTNTRFFPYTKPPQNPKILEIQRNTPEITHEQLQDLTNEEFLNKFTLKKLHKKWKKTFPYNFGLSTKKFSDDCASKNTIESKKYIKDLLDPDIFEVKIPRWNKSTKPDKTDKVPLKKTLFEVNNGFNNYLVTPLKGKTIEEGTDSRNIHIFGDDWNISNKLEKKEKKILDEDLYIKSMNNTQKYWLTRNYERMNEMELPISSQRKQIEEPRYYKAYQDPKSLTIYNYEKMKRAKNDLWLEKEKIIKEEIMKNMGSEPEKIKYLVEKRMMPKYKERFDIITGKKKEITNEAKKNSHWKDEELSEKIQLINDWKDTNWFKPNKTCYNSEVKKREILKYLVTNKNKIIREQEILREKKLNDSTKKMKHDLMEQRHQELKERKTNPTQISKYPIKKKFYETVKNNYYSDNEINKDYNTTLYPYNYTERKTALNSTFNKSDLTDDPNLFLDAYKTVVVRGENLKKNKTNYCKGANKWIEFKYNHPGKYREFNYETGGGDDHKKQETFMAWSCCNNTDKNARGCQKVKINKHKWNLDNA